MFFRRDCFNVYKYINSMNQIELEKWASWAYSTLESCIVTVYLLSFFSFWNSAMRKKFNSSFLLAIEYTERICISDALLLHLLTWNHTIHTFHIIVVAIAMEWRSTPLWLKLKIPHSSPQCCSLQSEDPDRMPLMVFPTNDAISQLNWLCESENSRIDYSLSLSSAFVKPQKRIYKNSQICNT